jgi:hypothetical protein
MRRFSSLVCLTLCTPLVGAVGCTADSDDPTPDEYLGVDEADLASAEPAPADLAAWQVPLGDGDLSLPDAVRFQADPTLAADGEVEALLAREAPPSPAGAARGPEDRSMRKVVVAVRWGFFPPQAAETWFDGSGFVAIAGGGRVELLRPLRFDGDLTPPLREHEDFVRPDRDPRIVRFRSHTRPAWDGLLLKVSRPHRTPAALVIRVGATTRVLPFEELFELNASEVVDDAGHELKIAARALPREHECVMAVARAEGTWQPGGPEDGLFAGTMTAAERTLSITGLTIDTRGPYGRFRGLIKNEAGELVAGARGVYAQFHYQDGGLFVGRIADGDRSVRGALVGRAAGNVWQGVVLHKDPACTPAP